MKETREYIEYLEDYVIVERCSKKEITELVSWYMDDKEFDIDGDNSLAVLYKDGTTYYDCGGDNSGKLRKSNIEAVILSNPCTYQVWGDVELDENGVMQFT